MAVPYLPSRMACRKKPLLALSKSSTFPMLTNGPPVPLWPWHRAHSSAKIPLPRVTLPARGLSSSLARGRRSHVLKNATMASTSARESGPPRMVDQADIVVPFRPLLMACRRKSSLTDARKEAWVMAGA